MIAQPGPPPELTPREREGLRQSVTENVRGILATLPRDAEPWRAQQALYRAGVAAPLPVVTGWLDAVRDAYTTSAPHDNDHEGNPA